MFLEFHPVRFRIFRADTAKLHFPNQGIYQTNLRLAIEPLPLARGAEIGRELGVNQFLQKESKST